MKRKIYILCFTLLGVLFAMFLSAIFELLHTHWLLNHPRSAWGVTVQSWTQIYSMLAFSMIVLGAIIGYKQGDHWWQILYVQQRYSKHFSHPLKKEF